MIIETKGLTKYYGEKLGCSDVSISVAEGEIFGFLGTNGAGKSTFIKMMTGLIFPTCGQGYILGKPIGDVKVRAKIGYLPELFRFQDWMTGLDLLSFHASLYKIDKKVREKRIDEVLEIVNLKGSEKYRIGTYSKGMCQRIGIASALLNKPELLFLDEPTSALDPIGRKEVRDIIINLKQQGKTVFLNSHLLSEVELICDTVAIINKGKILNQGRIDDILNSKDILKINAKNISNDILKKLKIFDSNIVYLDNILKIIINSNDDIPKIASIIVNNGGELYELAIEKENLENKFINLIKGENKNV